MNAGTLLLITLILYLVIKGKVETYLAFALEPATVPNE